MLSFMNLFCFSSPAPSSRPRRRHLNSESRSWGVSAAWMSVQQLETRVLLAATPVSGAWTGGVFDHIGLFENGVWQLDLDGDFYVGDDSPPFQFGQPGDLPVTGDWDGDGVHSVGVFRDGTFYLDFNDNRLLDADDVVAAFGAAGDHPIAGDWNGDGVDEIGVFRNAQWALDTSGNFEWGGGDDAFVFGAPGDRPMAGDWNPATSRDSIAIFRDGMWAIDLNEDFQFTSADVSLSYGASTSRPFTGDFIGTNADEIGVVTAAGTPFIRTIPQSSNVIASSSPPVAESTSRSLTTSETATNTNVDDFVATPTATDSATPENDEAVASGDELDDERELLFTRDNWQELERFTLTGMDPSSL